MRPQLVRVLPVLSSITALSGLKWEEDPLPNPCQLYQENLKVKVLGCFLGQYEQP